MVYISPGNIRMNIPTFSLPAVQTCPGRTDNCEKYCYAKKAEMCYKQVLPSRRRNYEDTKKKSFVKKATEKISKIKSEYIRIHESGDFYSQEYLNKWIKICNKFPEKKFLIYTQMYDLDWSNLPDNTVRYWTIWPDSKGVPETGLKAYVIDDGKNKIGNHKDDVSKIRECTKGKGNSIKCNDCMWCYEGKGDIKFKIH